MIICHAAVHKNAGALQFVPDAYKTPELCLAAVTKKGLALKYVLEELKTSALCRVPFSNAPGHLSMYRKY